MPTEYFFAVTSQIGVEHWPDANHVEWLDVQPTLGWTPTSGAATAELDALMDQPVLACGRVGPVPERPPLRIEPRPGPIMQMRSDWVSTPRGIRIKRSDPVAEHFFLSTVRRLDELAVSHSGDRIVATFSNPLPFALTGVRLRVRYEGCYGKPGSASLESDPRTLGPGETLEHEFPVIVERDGPRGRKHLASALVLLIDGSEDAKVWVDLDVSLWRLGLALECD